MHKAQKRKVKLHLRSQTSTPLSQSLELPLIRTHSNRARDLNKYYISPIQRYKTHHLPPHGPGEPQDETYIYRNLHKQRFWSISVSLPKDQLPFKKQLAEKANVQALQRFKNYMEQRGNRRIPMIVKQLLSQQTDQVKEIC